MRIFNNLGLEINGSSHGEYVEAVIGGFPKDEHVDIDELTSFMERRKSSATAGGTPRRETDEVIFSQGLENGVTTGEDIVARVYNKLQNSSDYTAIKTVMRPSHADYVAYVKYDGKEDMRGGGKFSGRMTLAHCIAGGIASQLLAKRGIFVGAYISELGGIKSASYINNDVSAEAIRQAQQHSVMALDSGAREEMKEVIASARAEGDSVGGVIECVVLGMPVGKGETLLQGLEGRLAACIYSIPAVKGVEFGSGFKFALMKGSEANDRLIVKDGAIVAATNNNGGINGGISNGMPITLRVAVKPTPSIAKMQRTVDVATMQEVDLQIKGRHDACIVPRAVVCVESAVAMVILDSLLD